MNSAYDQTLYRSLFAFFKRRIGNFHEAEDLTQEVFVRLARSVDLASINNLSAYIFKVAANLLCERVRRQHAQKLAMHLDVAEAVNSRGLPSALVEEIDAERILLGKAVLADLVAALEELPERTRNIFTLYRLEHMRQRDIAARIGISVSAVEKHLVKAIAHITTRLDKHGQ